MSEEEPSSFENDVIALDLLKTGLDQRLKKVETLQRKKQLIEEELLWLQVEVDALERAIAKI